MPVLSFLAALTPVGCSEREKCCWTLQSPEQNFEKALEGRLGDERREAVVRIAESDYVTSEDAFQILDAVARTDPVSQVRCIALRAFGQYNDNRPVGPILMTLNAKNGSGPREALPANTEVRLEAARSLMTLQRKGLLDAGQDTAALEIFLKLVTDPSRDVRLVALEALGRFQNARVLTPLIQALHTDDFAIADRAEQSLILLTGTTNNYAPAAWEKWLTATQDPFANAGKLSPTTRTAEPNWWDEQMKSWRRGTKPR